MKLFTTSLSILCLSLTLASCTGGSHEEAPEAAATTDAATEAAPAEGAAAPACNAQSGSVCGADGKTYPSECEAQAGGVTSYESGVCGETK